MTVVIHDDHEPLAPLGGHGDNSVRPDERDPGVQSPGGPGQLPLESAEGETQGERRKHHRSRT